MISPAVSIYCQSIPGQEVWNTSEESRGIINIADGGLGWGGGRARYTGPLRNDKMRMMDIDHVISSSFRCDFEDTAQYRVSAMNSKGELSAFASVVVKSKSHPVIKQQTRVL